MTLIDLTNVRDLAVVDPHTGESDPPNAGVCVDGACHAGPPVPSVDARERARG